MTTCQWIDRDPTPDDTCKCGKPCLPAKPYCAEHYRRAYQQQETRNKEKTRHA